MPGVEDTYLARGAMIAEPREGSLMHRGLKCFTVFECARGANDYRWTGRAEFGVTTSGGERWRKVLAYCSSTANVGYQHPFLHCPGVIANDESPNAAIAIVLAYRMSIVNRLALGEDRILRGQREQMFTLHEKQHQIRLLCGMSTVVVGYFWRPYDILDAPTVEPLDFFGPEEPVFQDAVKLPRDVVLLGRRE